MFTSNSIPPKNRRLQAFTLVEVILALAVLMLLVGVLFAVVDTTLRAATELEERQNKNRELNAFLSLCRKTFVNMPATVTFQARLVPLGKGFYPELIFRNAPGLWWWGEAKNASTSTILGVRGQVGGLVGLGILQDSEDQINSYLNGGTAARPWLMLLPDLRNAQWRFYDAGSQTWTKEWVNSSNRPACAELTLETAEGTSTYAFRVPPVVKLQTVQPL